MKNIIILVLIAIMLFSCSLREGKQEISNSEDTIVLSVGIVQDSISQCTNSDKFDTVMYLICHITNDIDTVSTRVNLKGDSTYVFYCWTKNQNVLWAENLVSSTVKSEKMRHKVEDFIPETYKVSDFQDLMDFCVDFGVDDLMKKGHEVDTASYRKYVLNYKGDLITWGHPESREGLFIWYEPLKIFVLFYQP
jgi:hypothetical protein